jgi:hypothetical protein
LEFLLGQYVRVDQKLLATGQTALHLLAEDGDLRTMQIFLKGALTGLGSLDVAAHDGKNFNALDYLNLRENEDELKSLFDPLVKRIKDVRKQSYHSFLKGLNTQPNTIDCEDEDEDEDDETFANALENQPEISSFHTAFL